MNVGQIWMATLSLDPAICRDVVRYLRALSALILGAQDDDPELTAPLASLEFLADLTPGPWLRSLMPALAGEQLTPAPVISRPR